jgi:para-nitrobenzyl esterase
MDGYGMPVFGLVQEAYPAVETCHGKIRGDNRNNVAVFRGIPYGGSCSGKQRFLPPVAAANWTGVRDCTVNGYYAVQYGSSISGSDNFGPYFSGGKPELFGVIDEKQDEDCLVLNVLTPALDMKKRPVLVYIHGGGFASGSGTLVLGADQFVREEDIVVVGINHRLNVFGYLYLGAFDKKYAESGMAGMLDLVLALEWVKDNIAAFGGDPYKVTIMGESGGGMKVSALLAMEKAKNLFKYAIVESGSAVTGRTGPEEGTCTASEVLKRLNIGPRETCKLIDLPAKELLAATSGSNLLKFVPVADGINLTYNESDCFTVPETSASVPLLVGASDDELAAFIEPNDLTITWDTLRGELLRVKKGIGSADASICTERNVDTVIEILKSTDIKHCNASHHYLKAASLNGFLGGGAFHHAMAKAEKGTAPVYHYMVTYDSPHPYIEGKRFAWHTADLPLQLRIVLHPESEKLSRTMAHSWAAFIRTGNPSTNELQWPEFSTARRETMVFDDTTGIQCDPFREIREALARRDGH